MPQFRFSVGVFNQTVRDYLHRGERHPDLSDRWADVHYVDVWAEDKVSALEKVRRRYPGRLGYCLTDVIEER